MAKSKDQTPGAAQKRDLPPIATSGQRLSNELIAAAINKACGSESIRCWRSNDRSNVTATSTGNTAIDIMLGCGGLPRGRVTECFGPESSGKTTFCLTVIAHVQGTGGRAAFIDVEHALDPKYARTLGVKMEDLLVSQPDNGEHALRILESLLRLNAVDVIVIDSVAALVPQSELSGEIGDVQPGAQARLMSQAMRRITGVTARSNTIVIFTNQIREKIGVMYGNPETTPGGRALKFFASVRLDIRRKDTIKDSAGNAIGTRVRLKAVKNKVAPPFKEAEVNMYFADGICEAASLLELALEYKVIEKKGSWYHYNGQILANGTDETRTFLRQKPELARELRARVMAAAIPPAETEAAAPDEKLVALAAGAAGDDSESVLNGIGELKVGDTGLART